MSEQNKNALHHRAIVIDLHADTAQRLVDEENFDIMSHNADGHLDAPRMREGGLDAQFFSIWVEPEHYGIGGETAVNRADVQIKAVHEMTQKHSDDWELATTADDVRRISSQGKLSALMGMEGGYAIDEKLENVEKYFSLGVRYMSPAWSVSTSWAGSSNDEIGKSLGLTEFGKDVIREMNRLGMMVDVSHVSDLAFWDIINTTKKPVIASHSNARSLASHPRNLTDDMIRAVADNGGVMCVVFYSAFLDDDWSAEKNRVDEELKPHLKRLEEEFEGTKVQKWIAKEKIRMKEFARKIQPLTVSRVVDHIDHIVKLSSVTNVGIGSDFDGIPATPKDLSSVAELPNLTEELLRRGYSENDVVKILGENILRVMKEVLECGDSSPLSL
jgi:membrane dipeptidase